MGRGEHAYCALGTPFLHPQARSRPLLSLMDPSPASRPSLPPTHPPFSQRAPALPSIHHPPTDTPSTPLPPSMPLPPPPPTPPTHHCVTDTPSTPLSPTPPGPPAAGGLLLARLPPPRPPCCSGTRLPRPGRRPGQGGWRPRPHRPGGSSSCCCPGGTVRGGPAGPGATRQDTWGSWRSRTCHSSREGS